MVTHHLPAAKSVDKRYANDPLNPAFASRLEGIIERFQPVLWIHGHTHVPGDYEIFGTRVVCNPRGYTAAQWNDIRDNLVAVWDDMPSESVSAVIYNHVDIPQELESAVDALEEGHGLARGRIAKLNATLPEEDRLILVGSVSSPVKADIYRDQIPVV